MTATETQFDPDGFIKDPNAWNRELAQSHRFTRRHPATR